MRAWDEGLDFRELVQGRRRTRRPCRPRPRVLPRCLHGPCRPGVRPPAGRRRVARGGGPPDALHLGSGKVRELYALGHDRLLLVATDRISTFDVVLPTEIPDKGRVLAGLSAFWFARTRHIVENHFLAVRPDGRSLGADAWRCSPVELVVRGYLAGSGWTDYRDTGQVCSLVPPRLVESDQSCRNRSSRLRPRPSRATISTSPRPRPRRSARRGVRVRARGSARALPASPRATPRVRDPPRGHEVRARHRHRRDEIARGRGAHSRLVTLLARRRVCPGTPQPSFDKQYVQDFCLSTGWDRTAPGPELPEDVVAGTRARYVEAFERLTGIPFDRYLDDPEVVL